MCNQPDVPDYGPLAEAQRYAADKQFEASQNAIKEWREQKAQTREDFSPWRKFGLTALKKLETGITEGLFDPEEWQGFNSEQMKMDPGYAFRMQQGQQAMMRALNASGTGVGGGAAGKALTRYGQEFASNEFAAARSRALQDYSIRQQGKQVKFNNLMRASGVGQSSTAQVAGHDQAATGQITHQMGQGAAALGAGEIGAANAMIAQQQAQAQADQMGFQNMMGVLGMGLGVAGFGMNMGWWGGGGGAAAGGVGGIAPYNSGSFGVF